MIPDIVFAEGYGDEVYNEFREFVVERDPQTIAVNTSEWLPVADGISHTAYIKLVNILGPTYSERIVSAENVITDFVVRRTSQRGDGADQHPGNLPPDRRRGIVPHRTGCHDNS